MIQQCLDISGVKFQIKSRGRVKVGESLELINSKGVKASLNCETHYLPTYYPHAHLGPKCARFNTFKNAERCIM